MRRGSFICETRERLGCGHGEGWMKGWTLATVVLIRALLKETGSPTVNLH
jgi:hypothetical protein